MSHKLRIDYHFHPNLPANNRLANKKCQEFWNRFGEKSINCVVVMEHSYKNPRRAYELMLKTKPNGFFVFPGVEYITKEGIDVAIFSKDCNIYKIKELKSFNLSFKEVINLAESNKGLFVFPVHPYTLGHTSVIKKLGYQQYKAYINKLGALEIANSTLDDVKCCMNKLPFLFKSQLSNIAKTQNIPKTDHPDNINFLAVGSDAHYPEDIGYCYEIELDNNSPLDQASVFEQVINNHGLGRPIRVERKIISMVHFLKILRTSLNESLIKIFLRAKL